MTATPPMPTANQIAGPHIAAYEILYKQADHSGTGSVSAMEAATFLKRSGLKEAVLSQIWDLSDPGGRGFLDRQGLFTALKLVALVQNGKEPTMAALNTPVPPPTLSTPGSPALAPLGSTDSAWVISSSEKAKYDQIFEGLKPVNGMLSGDQVRPVLMNSNLAVDLLGRVWDLSDIDKDGFLDRDEFCVAMHLVYRALEKDPVPVTLPSSLVPPSKRRKVGLAGAVPVLPSYAGASSGTGRDSPSRVSSSLTVSGGSPAVGLPASPPWVVTYAEMAQCEERFKQADLDQDGFVDGQQIRPVLLQFGLASHVLAHIWSLCDIQSTGKLNLEQFALALHLIQQKLQGLDPPQQLPPEMVPPSLRAPAGANLLDGLGTLAPSEAGCKELDMISTEIDNLKRDKMNLEQEKTQKEADIKVRSSEVQALQKELDSINITVKQLETQKGEAQKRLDELDDKRNKLQMSVVETKEKCENEQKQMSEMKEQITSQESMVRNQEEELRKLREQLTSLRQQEVALESKVQTNKTQLDQLNKGVAETQAHILQSQNNLEKLQETQESINRSISQYNALISGDTSAEEPSPNILAALASEADATSVKATLGSSSLSSLSGFSMGGVEDKSGRDPFTNNNSDPFQNEDPFKNSNNDDPFKGTDPFKDNDFGGATSGDPFGGADPFGGDVFGSGGASSGDQFAAFASSGGGDGFAGRGDDPFSMKPAAMESSDDPTDPFGGDPFKKGLSAARPTTATNDPFNPLGTGLASLTSPVNAKDPFGTDPFQPNSNKSPRRSKGQAPPPPSLPPKKKKVPTATLR